MNSIKTLRQFLAECGPFEPYKETPMQYPCYHTPESLQSSPQGVYLLYSVQRKEFHLVAFSLDEVIRLADSDTFIAYGPIPLPTNGETL